MKKNGLSKVYIVLLILLTNIFHIQGSSTEYYYDVSVFSFGNYDLQGKTFYIVSDNETDVDLDLEFQYYRDILTQCFILRKAIPTNDSINADMRIQAGYGIGQAGSSHSIGATGTVMFNSTAVSTTALSTTTDFHRYIYLKAYDNHNEGNVMLWKTCGESNGFSSDLPDAVPAIAQAMLPKFGKNDINKKSVYIYCSDPDIMNMKEGLYLQDNIIVNPTNWSDSGNNGKKKGVIMRAVTINSDTAIVRLQVIAEEMTYKDLLIRSNTYIIHNGTKYPISKFYTCAKDSKRKNRISKKEQPFNKTIHIFSNITEIQLLFPVQLNKGETIELISYKNKRETSEAFHFSVVLE